MQTLINSLALPQFIPCLEDFPLKGDYLKWVGELASTLWNDISEIDSKLAPLLSLECDRLICDPPIGDGWFKRSSDKWQSITVADLPECLLVDVESKQLPSGQWQAFLCTAISPDGTWFAWQGESVLIPSTTGTLFIGHNASAHDSQFFTSEYIAPGVDKTSWLDTRSLVEILRGIHPDQYAEFDKFSKALASGKGGAPEWMSKAALSNLADACKSFLGIQINKSVQGGMINGVEAPKSVFEYCCQDVWATLKLFQMVYPMARATGQSPIWWWGKLAITGLRYPVRGWDAFLETLTDECEASKKVKPADRSSQQSELVKWGISHLAKFDEAVIHNGIMALRINPCNVMGGMNSAIWNYWIKLDNIWPPQFAVPGDDAYPLAATPSDQANGVFEVSFNLPTAPVMSESKVKVMAAQEQPTSRYLKVRCPMSITGAKLKADWLQKCDQPEVLAMFVTIMNAFILEYELDAWLAVPGVHHALYAGRGNSESRENLKACGDEAIRIVQVILDGVKAK